MPKRKDPTSHNGDDADSDSGSDFEEMDVDFEWFDPQPAVDFHGLKTLCRQLFDIDHELFDLSALADIILEQPLLGSTVKTDGNESDPLAFLTVINLWQHREKPVIQTLVKYIQTKVPSTSPLQQLLSSQLDPTNNTQQAGLILTERLINMPAKIVPPMYTCLQEEVQWALEENEPYNFTHYLILSKVYNEVESKLDAEDARPSKKSKKTGNNLSEMFFFHPEDEVLAKSAIEVVNYPYTKVAEDGASDARRAFQEMGIVSRGYLTCVPADKFAGAVEAMAQFVNSEG